jgi:hypothetical protein
MNSGREPPLEGNAPPHGETCNGSTKLTILSQVEGQSLMTTTRMIQTSLRLPPFQSFDIMFRAFEHSDFEFVSDLELRISGFRIPDTFAHRELQAMIECADRGNH